MPMMRLTEPRDAEALTSLCGGSLLGAYILSRFFAYANDYSFAKCYIDCRHGEAVTALSVLEHSAVLVTSDKTDYEELALALPVLSVQTIMTDSAAAKRLPFPVVQTKQAFRFSGSDEVPDAENDAPMREIYDLISRSIPDSFPAEEDAYLRFLSDFTFRRSRGFARLKAVLQNGRVCACALTAAECSSAAVLSGVACAEDCRGNGFGRRVVTALAGELKKENKEVYVIALNDSACAFYRRIGFFPAEKIYWLKI